MGMVDASILRVGICYDGAYYQRVSDYYLRHHPSQSRLSFTGFHDFLRAEVAARFDIDVQRTRVVEAHYYRGRLPTRLATERDLVVSERAWDESLGFAGIVPHYFPLSVGPGDKLGEKGVDVALALDAYDLALRKQVDVLVLIASDGDFVPLLRRLHGTGTAVLLPVWDVMYTDDRGVERQLRAASRLRAEAMWTIDVPGRLESLAADDPSRVSAIFVPRREPLSDEMSTILARIDARRVIDGEPPPTAATESVADAMTHEDDPDDEPTNGNAESLVRHDGVVTTLKDAFGFLRADGFDRDIFFHRTDVRNGAFSTLRVGAQVQFAAQLGDQGYIARSVTVRYAYGPVEPRSRPTFPVDNRSTPRWSDDAGYPL